MATKEQLKEWIVNNQDKQGKEGKDGQDFEKVKQKYISLKASGGSSEAVDYNKNTERLRTAAQGLTLGFGDEIEAGVRSIGSDDSYETIRDRIRGRLNQYSSDNPGEALGIEMAGSLVIPGGVARTAAVKGGKMALSKVAGYNAGLGAGYGAGMSEGENASEIAADATLGGAIGGIGGAGLQAISRNFRPLVQDGAIDQARKAVARGGGYVTRGQAIGGNSKKIEDSLSNVMPSIKAAQADGLKGFNVEVMDKIFKQATNKMDKANQKVFKELEKDFLNASNSEQQIKVINKAVDKAYDEAFEGGGVKLKAIRDREMNQELTKWLSTFSDSASKSEIAVLKSLKAEFTQRIGKGKFGQQAKEVQKTLKENAARAKSNPDSLIANTYNAQAGLTNIFKNAVARQNSPKKVELLNSIDGIYGNVLNLRKLLAATTNKNAFTVNDATRFLTQTNAKTPGAKANNKAQRKTVGLDNVVSKEMDNIYGSTTGDSGTGAGLMSIGTIASMGGLVGSGAIMNPAVIGAITAIGLKAFQYSPFMLKRFNKMIAQKNYRKAAKMIEQYGAQSGAAGLLSNESVESYQQ